MKVTTNKSDVLKSIRLNLNLLAATRGIVFWYAIEKLFELEIGITTQQIVLMGILAQGSRMIFEIPSSILADRWSRRNVLIASNIAMIICSLVLGISSNFTEYLVGSIFWGLSYALSSGTYEAYTYDLLATNKLSEH